MKFKKGEVYYVETPDKISIRRLSKDGLDLHSNSKIIIIKNSNEIDFWQDDNPWGITNIDTTVRLAYSHEVAWLEACEMVDGLIKPAGYSDYPYVNKHKFATVSHEAFNIGDEVVITDRSHEYFCYDLIRNAYGFCNKNDSNFSSIFTEDFKIIDIISHSRLNKLLLILQHNNAPAVGVVISPEGVKLIKKADAPQPKIGAQQVNINNNGKTEKSSDNRHRAEDCSSENTIKIGRLVSRVTTGERPSGSIFRGRTSAVTVKSRHLSYNQSVIRS